MLVEDVVGRLVGALGVDVLVGSGELCGVGLGRDVACGVALGWAGEVGATFIG